jgi:hypothetical protein
LQIVFASATWIGRQEDNPGEEALPMPAFMTTPKHDDAVLFGQGLAAREGIDNDIKAPPRFKRNSKRKMFDSDDNDHVSDDDDLFSSGGGEEGSDRGEAQAPPRKRPARAAAARASLRCALRMNLRDVHSYATLPHSARAMVLRSRALVMPPCACRMESSASGVS